MKKAASLVSSGRFYSVLLLRHFLFWLLLFSFAAGAVDEPLPAEILDEPVSAEMMDEPPPEMMDEPVPARVIDDTFAPIPTNGEKSVTLNLSDADIRAFIATVSEMTGKNFIVDPRVKGRVTMIFSSPTSPANIYEVFLSVLKVHGYAAVPSGDAIKIIPDAGAKQDSIPTLSGDEAPDSDDLLTQVVQVNHADASQLATILRPLLPQQAHIAAHTGSNTLLITDTASNVHRLVNIIRRIDQANNFGVSIIKLQHARADTLVQTLNQLIKTTVTKGAAPDQVQSISADERTNSLILNGDPSWRTNITGIIMQLDQPVENEGNTEVIYLKYAKAKTLSEVLRGVGDKMLKSSQGSGKAPSTESQFDIQADESTNALVVTAPPYLMTSLKSVIDKLDIRREQVHIEAIIAELRDDKAIEMGVEWQTPDPTRGFYATTRTPISGASGSVLGGTVVPGTLTVGSGFTLGYFTGGDIRALIKAFASDTDTNILSTPSLVTLDNEEASIHVGQNVPFVTGQYTNSDAAGATNPFQTIERHDVGIKLNVTPHINEGKTIELKIDQEVSSVTTNPDVEGLTTNKRTINTTVLVDDGEIIVLGGLIEDDLSEGDSKVPLLGDIPLLGYLFSSKRTTYNKKNLMVFLRPHILRNAATNRILSEEQYKRIRNQQQEGWKDGIEQMPNEEPPLLPNQPEYRDTPAPVSEVDLSFRP